MEITRKIPQWAEGRTLIDYLSARIVLESKTRLRRLIAGGGIRVNGHVVNSSVSLNRADNVTMPATLRLEGPEYVDLDIEILFEDDDHIVINKPAGLPVMAGRNRSDPKLYNRLLMELNRGAADSGPYTRPHIVHRLDRETTGVLLVAKHRDAARKLAGQFQKRTVKKQYAGIVEGVFPRDKYVADISLKEAAGSAIAMAPTRGKGKQSVTEIEVLRRYGHFTFIRMRPLTGRRHQLRVHLAALGYPLAVDFLYGVRDRLTLGDFFDLIGKKKERSGGNENDVLFRGTPLHAESITYRLPADGAFNEQKAPLPPNMLSMLALLEEYDRKKTPDIKR